MNFPKKHDTAFIICNILVPLVIGAYIYVYWDTDSYFGNCVRYYFTIPRIEKSADIIKFMRNWGCDFLWAYTLFFSLFINTRDVSASIRYAVICSTVLELLQLIQIDFLKCGTFDILDIIIEIIAVYTGAAVLDCYHYINKKRGGIGCGRK